MLTTGPLQTPRAQGWTSGTFLSIVTRFFRITLPVPEVFHCPKYLIRCYFRPAASPLYQIRRSLDSPTLPDGILKAEGRVVVSRIGKNLPDRASHTPGAKLAGAHHQTGTGLHYPLRDRRLFESQRHGDQRDPVAQGIENGIETGVCQRQTGSCQKLILRRAVAYIRP